MKLIPVCSGKGGTGKSCVAAYTGLALAAAKKKTLLIDLAAAPGSLDTILGVGDAAIFNVWDVLCGRCEPDKAILQIPGNANLSLVPTGLPPSEPPQMSFVDLIRAVKYDYDYILVDSPDFSLFAPSLAATVLMVTTPDTLSVRAAAQKTRELYEAGAKSVRLVINNVPARVLPMKSFRDFDELIDLVGAQLIAVVPASQRLQYAANNGLPVSPESLTVQVFQNLAARLRGKNEPLLIK